MDYLGKAKEIISEYPYSHVYRDYIRVAHEYWNNWERPGLVAWEIISVACLKGEYHKDNNVGIDYYEKERGLISKHECNKVVAILKGAGFILTSTSRGAQGYSGHIRRVYGHPKRKYLNADKIIEDFEKALEQHRGKAGDEIHIEESSS